MDGVQDRRWKILSLTIQGVLFRIHTLASSLGRTTSNRPNFVIETLRFPFTLHASTSPSFSSAVVNLASEKSLPSRVLEVRNLTDWTSSSENSTTEKSLLVVARGHSHPSHPTLGLQRLLNSLLRLRTPAAASQEQPKEAWSRGQ
ncbi:unnamed protein product [Linum trigynum]|uniref:Uncharacterized protein n=1 Tax=Linum trigynum TaxID=586398 RepID=A0AAV2FE72_9ROSI